MEKQYSRYYTFIRPIIKNKRVQQYSTITFSIFAVIIFSLFAIKPTISTILALQKSIKQEQDIYNQLLTKEKNLALGKQNLDAIPVDTMAKTSTLLPDQTDITIVTDNLASIAQQNQASVSAIQYQPFDLVGVPATLNPHPNLQEISFTLNLQGDYLRIAKLLQDLNNSGRLVVIDSINMVESNESPLNTTINGRTFYLKN
jgi:Tfp pilus assembly protein PilO